MQNTRMFHSSFIIELRSVLPSHHMPCQIKSWLRGKEHWISHAAKKGRPEWPARLHGWARPRHSDNSAAPMQGIADGRHVVDQNTMELLVSHSGGRKKICFPCNHGCQSCWIQSEPLILNIKWLLQFPAAFVRILI